VAGEFGIPVVPVEKLEATVREIARPVSKELRPPATSVSVPLLPPAGVLVQGNVLYRPPANVLYPSHISGARQDARRAERSWRRTAIFQLSLAAANLPFVVSHGPIWPANAAAGIVCSLFALQAERERRNARERLQRMEREDGRGRILRPPSQGMHLQAPPTDDSAHDQLRASDRLRIHPTTERRVERVQAALARASRRVVTERIHRVAHEVAPHLGAAAHRLVVTDGPDRRRYDRSELVTMQRPLAEAERLSGLTDYVAQAGTFSGSRLGAGGATGSRSGSGGVVGSVFAGCSSGS
jgi:hypothetical protein